LIGTTTRPAGGSIYLVNLASFSAEVRLCSPMRNKVKGYFVAVGLLAVSSADVTLSDSVQVFSRVVSHGLEGRRLRATYKEADQLEYQDSLGQLLLATASTVPDGLLLFLPSYALMEKLSKRWQVGAQHSTHHVVSGSVEYTVYSHCWLTARMCPLETFKPAVLRQQHR
jgi:hypothetical protein